MEKTINKAKRTGQNPALMMAMTAILCATAVVLSYIENILPDFPFVLPGMKLGLSNVVLMVSIELFPLPCSLMIVLFKAMFALFTRGATAAVMSLSGGVLATFMMFLLMHSRYLRFGSLGIGVAGAFGHNMGQLLAAFFIVSDAVYSYLPVLCGISIITGALTGLLDFVLIPMLCRIPNLSFKNFDCFR